MSFPPRHPPPPCSFTPREYQAPCWARNDHFSTIFGSGEIQKRFGVKGPQVGAPSSDFRVRTSCRQSNRSSGVERRKMSQQVGPLALARCNRTCHSLPSVLPAHTHDTPQAGQPAPWTLWHKRNATPTNEGGTRTVFRLSQNKTGVSRRPAGSRAAGDTNIDRTRPPHTEPFQPFQVEYRRERWDTPDGDFLDVDFLDTPGGKGGGGLGGQTQGAGSAGAGAIWAGRPDASTAPFAVLTHGLESTSTAPLTAKMALA